MIESNNGESLSYGRAFTPKRHTAKHCPLAIRERIVNALANGDSKRAIARALGVSNNTVTAIAEQNWQQVAARKGRLAAQWEQVATKAVDHLNDHLDASTLSPNALVPIAGVATDKLLALSGDGPTPFRDLHLHGLADDDIVAFAVHLSKKKPVKAEIIDEAPKALPHT